MTLKNTTLDVILLKEAEGTWPWNFVLPAYDDPATPMHSGNHDVWIEVLQEFLVNPSPTPDEPQSAQARTATPWPPPAHPEAGR